MAVRNFFHLAPPDGLDYEEPVDVLFVAGDPDLAELYRIKLELDGYRVTIVDSVDEAIEAVERQLRLQAIASWRALRQEPSMRNSPMILLSRLDARRFAPLRAQQGWFDHLITVDGASAMFGSMSGNGNHPISTAS